MRQVQPPPPRIIQNTVHQTVIHLHQTTHQHILNRLSVRKDFRGARVLPAGRAVQPVGGREIDSSRPALEARRMLRILSMDGAQQILRPFYQNLFRQLLDREREEYRGRPARSLLLIQSLLGRHRTLTTLRRVYRETTQRLEGSAVHGFIHRLPAARRPVPLPQRPEEGPERAPEKRRAEGLPQVGSLRLSDAEFQLLVRGVADILGRRERLTSMRGGGM